MKRNIITLILLVAVFLTGTMVGVPLVSASSPISFWTASIPTVVTEALVVKSGTTILPNGYVFSVVNLKVGDVHTKTITVQNTGSVAFLVKPVAASPSPSVTAVWNNESGVSIVVGGSADFVLTITAIATTDSISIPVSFTRE